MPPEKRFFFSAIFVLHVLIFSGHVASGHIFAAAADDTSRDDYSRQVEETRNRSMEQRLERLKTAAEGDSLWPAPSEQAWGDMMWANSVLYIDERVDDANKKILEHAASDQPYAYFGLVDYVRILVFYNSRSEHFPGRLALETENAVKEILWNYVNGRSFVKDTRDDRGFIEGATDAVWFVHNSENHDLIRKVTYYLVASVLQDDPVFRDRKYQDGHTPSKHYEAWNEYFKQFLVERATKGLLVELGSSTYRKYTYPTILNLFDLSPDPLLRKLARMFLDIAFMEEAQISFNDGLRGGGISRGTYGDRNWESMKRLLYGEGGGSTHSRVLETSRYQLPAAAILMRNLETDVGEPFVIQNRVPGQEISPRPHPPEHWGTHAQFWYPLADDSALVNYCYRTPYYMLGSTLQDPSVTTSAISHQSRDSGIVFNNENRSVIRPRPDPSRPRSGRTHDAYWNFQYENIMIAQKLEKSSYVIRMMLQIAPELALTEFRQEDEAGKSRDWLFATDGNAFAAIKITGGYEWGKGTHHFGERQFVIPNNDYAPVLFYAGCPADGFDSLEKFRDHLLNDVSMETFADRIEIEETGKPKITFFKDFRLPMLNGKAIVLRPDFTYKSPYLRSEWQSGRVTVEYGDLKTVYDFNAGQILRH